MAELLRCALFNKKTSRLWEALFATVILAALLGPPNAECPANNDEDNNNDKEDTAADCHETLGDTRLFARTLPRMYI